MDSMKAKIAAMFAMATCCFAAMAIALGVIAISSTFLISGLAVAIAATCVLFMVVMMRGHGGSSGGHSHHGQSSHVREATDIPESALDKVS